MTVEEITKIFIVNNLGINLNSVRNVFVARQKDGQLKEIRIVFSPKKSTESQKRIKDWRLNHPSGTKAACYRDTGISRPTINKYWQDIGEEGSESE